MRLSRTGDHDVVGDWGSKGYIMGPRTTGLEVTRNHEAAGDQDAGGVLEDYEAGGVRRTSIKMTILVSW